MKILLRLGMSASFLFLGCACSTTPARADVAAVPEVDRSCRVDADCAVKDVGNCCGYYPACVNRTSPVFPERVRQQCEKTGSAGICGFPEIAACVCDSGQCAAQGTRPHAPPETR